MPVGSHGPRMRPRLRSRDREMAAIGEQLAAARAGLSTVSVIEAPAGLGKSRVLEEAAATAERLGIRVGLGRAREGDRMITAGALLDAVSSGPAALLPVADMPAPALEGEQYQWLLQELEARLEREALAGPLLLAIDDLQWADRGTAVALRTLPARLSGLPIAWLLAMRPGEASPELAAALDVAEAQRLRLGPLDDEAVGSLSAEVLGGRPDERVLELARGAHGSPYLLMELLVGLLEEDAVEVAGGTARLVSDELPERVSHTVQARLAHVPPQARDAAMVAPALGQELRFDDLAAMLGVEPAALVGPVTDLIDAELLVERGERLAFRHDLLREALIASLPPGAWRSLQRQAAEVMLERGARAVEVAPILVASALPGDEAAIRALYAAVQALGTSDPAAAAELARHTLELMTGSHALRARLVAETALLLHAAGQVDEGARFADSALREILPAEEEADVRLSIAGMFSLSPDIRARVGRTALSLPGLSPEMRARQLARLIHSVLSAGRLSEARQLIADARATILADGGDDARFALALAEGADRYTAGDFGAALDRIVAAIRSSEAAGDDGRLRLGQQWRAEVLFVLDRSDEALDVLLGALSAAQRENQAWAARWFELWRGRQLLQLGRLSDAAATLEGFFEDGDSRPSANVPEAVGMSALGRIALHTGSRATSARIAAVAEQMLAAGPPAVRRHGAWLLALQAAADGDDARALGRLSELGDDGLDSLLPVMGMDVTDPPRLARMALAADAPEIAADAARLAEDRRALNPGVASLAGAAAHARGLLTRDRDALDAAVDAFASGPRVLALAFALEDRAAHSTQSAAIDDLTRALTIYSDSGATSDAGRVRARLRGLGVRRRLSASTRASSGWSGLTESELTVVRLVGEGLTNRETAARLYLSPHTVSMHLRHAFAKLGINSRVELARLLVEHTADGD